MADKKDDAKESPALIRETQTDNFPTYQDEKALTAADAGKAKEDSGSSVNTVDLDHGEESPVAKAEREAREKDPFSPVPVQMLPENQDDSVKGK